MTLGLTGPVDDGHGDGNEHADKPRTAAPDEPLGENEGPRKHTQGANAKRGYRRRGSDSFLPSVHDLLATLARLSQLVITGMITPAQANAIGNVVRTMLAHMQKSDAPSAAGGADLTGLHQILRERPDLLHAIQPLLSPEQLAELADDEIPPE